MAKEAKEFIVVKIDANAQPKIEKLYNEGYRRWTNYATDNNAYVVFKLVVKNQ
jgi:hypothetical protein